MRHDGSCTITFRTLDTDIGRFLTMAAEPAVAADERHTRPLAGGLVPRRRGLPPRLLAAVVRSKATLAFAAERQVVMRIGFG